MADEQAYPQICEELNGFDFGIEPIKYTRVNTNDPILFRAGNWTSNTSQNYYITGSGSYCASPYFYFYGNNYDVNGNASNTTLTNSIQNGRFAVFMDHADYHGAGSYIYSINPWHYLISYIYPASNCIRHFTQCIHGNMATSVTDAEGNQVYHEAQYIECLTGWLDTSTFMFYILDCTEDYRMCWSVDQATGNASNNAYSVNNFNLRLQRDGANIPANILKSSVNATLSTAGSKRNYLYQCVIPVGLSDQFDTFASMCDDYTAANYVSTTTAAPAIRPMVTKKFPAHTPIIMLFTTSMYDIDTEYMAWIKQAVPKLCKFKLRKLTNSSLDPVQWFSPHEGSNSNQNNWGFNISDKFTPYQYSQVNFNPSVGTISTVKLGTVTKMVNDYSFKSTQAYESQAPPGQGSMDNFSFFDKYNITVNNNSNSGIYGIYFSAYMNLGNNKLSYSVPWTDRSNYTQYRLDYGRYRAGFGWIDFTYGWLQNSIFLLAANNASSPFKLWTTFIRYNLGTFIRRESLGPVHALIAGNSNNFSYAFLTVNNSASGFTDVFDMVWGSGSNTTNYFYNRDETAAELILLASVQTSDSAIDGLMHWAYENAKNLESIKNGTMFRKERLEANPKQVFYSYPERAFSEVPSI